MFLSLLCVLNAQHHYWHFTFERGKPICCLSLLIGFLLKASFTSYKSVQQFCLFEVLWNVLILFFEIRLFLRQYRAQHTTSLYRMLLLICTYCFFEMHGTWQKSLLHFHLVENSFFFFCITAAASLWLVCKLADHTTYIEYLCMKVWCILYASKYIFHVLYFPL